MNKTCKDCIHYDVCSLVLQYGKFAIDVCNKGFKDKARYIELPCAVGDDVWWIDAEDDTTIHCEKNGIKAIAYYGGDKFKVITDDNLPEEIGTRWCCLTQEEAENLVKRGNYDD